MALISIDRNVPVDMTETEKEIIIEAEIPGVKKEDIKLEIFKGLLTISGSVKHHHFEEDEVHLMTERQLGKFHRSINIPLSVDSDNIKASYKNGILLCRLPKQIVGVHHKRRIEIA